MKTANTVFVKTKKQKPLKNKQVKKVSNQKVIDKFFASRNNTQYNCTIEYVNKEKTAVKNFSIGFVLKEIQINTNNVVNHNIGSSEFPRKDNIKIIPD